MSSNNFEFIKRLGDGHFGQVWLINDAGLDAEFALKLIPAEKVINPNNFYQEAQVLKSAEHVNIVEVCETGQMQDGQIYVKMEFLKNGSLEDEVRGSHIPLSRAKKIMVDVLRGLGHAHSKNIIHRDIKPANILIGDGKEGKLSDFGLALPDLSKIDISVLKEYWYLAHLAPEVNKISNYTYLSDIYSCGLTLYRLVNGDKYLPNLMNSVDLIKMIKDGKFPNRNSYREFIPLSLRKIINKSLNIDPLKRFDSAESMRRTLERVKLQVNWSEKLLHNGIEWKGTLKKDILYLRRIKDKNNTWNVTFMRGKSLTKARKVSKYCYVGLDIKTAIQNCKDILQGFVNGEIK